MRRPPPTIVEFVILTPPKARKTAGPGKVFPWYRRFLTFAHADGRTVSLSQFATFEYEQEFPLIWRRDRVPTLTVQADVVSGALPATVINSFRQR
jgi:hypothetical protein